MELTLLVGMVDIEQCEMVPVNVSKTSSLLHLPAVWPQWDEQRSGELRGREREREVSKWNIQS